MDKPTNPLDLEEIKGLMAKATPLPWAKGGPFNDLLGSDGEPVQISGNVGIGMGSINGRPDRETNGNLILAAVNALPALIEQYERLREALERRDAKAAECPIDRTRQHRNEPCPRCRAGRGETCFVKNDADYRLVSEVRDILATQQEETNG